VQVFINEWLSLNSNSYRDWTDNSLDDWFELYNDGEQDVSLAGYQLTDDLDNPPFVIPSNIVIKAKGFLLVWADEDGDANFLAGETNLHANFRLSQNGDRIYLLSPEDLMIDAVEFGRLTADVSGGRWPDGKEPHVLRQATPGRSNQIPPMIEELDPVTLLQGEEFHALLTIVSPTVPARSTVIQIASASLPWITVTSNQLSIIPVLSTPPDVYQISLRVSDLEHPEINSVRDFTVEVKRLVIHPLLSAASRSGNGISFEFSGQQGIGYQLEYKTNLTDPQWLQLGQPIFGTNGPIPFFEQALDRQRFFRIRILE
jgi:hypothetical protein